MKLIKNSEKVKRSKKLVFAALVLSLCTVFVSMIPVQELVANNEKLPAVVRLYHMGSYLCTGTVIDNTHILTAAHCERELLEVRTQDGMPIGVFAKAWFNNQNTDIGLLYGDFSKFKHAKVASNPEEYEKQLKSTLKACGHPWGGALWCTKYTLESISYFQLQGKSMFYPGMSGGPIYSSSGYIIGVVSGVRDSQAIIAPVIELFSQVGEYRY